MAAGKNRIPEWLKADLKEEDLERIHNAVAKAEKFTDGEILPVIVHHSQAYRSAKRIFWLIVLLILTPFFLSIDHIYSFMIFAAFAGLYTADQIWPHVLGRQPWLVKFLDPRDVTEAVERRAALKFEILRIQHTEKRTGVLIFVSYLERRALILGDKAISEKINHSEWQGLLSHLLNGIAAGHMGQAFEEAILRMGEILKQHFPAEDGSHSDELSNDLVILDEI